ncbi:MAG: pectate lyase [Prevotellaceae bacterium]|jgi:hypothetical protein|nr:pectate lyase [Prevotellaceae bacterium]
MNNHSFFYKKPSAFLLLPLLAVALTGCKTAGEEPSTGDPSAPVIAFADAGYVVESGQPVAVSGTVTSSSPLASVADFVVSGAAETEAGRGYTTGVSYPFTQTVTPDTATTGFKVVATNKSGLQTTAAVPIVVVGGNNPPSSTTPAFPGAEGFGRYTVGGRGGKVLYVTNLTDNDTQGSLRWAVNQSGARTILFKVSGVIALNAPLNIRNANLTIAGQTAPGDGICLKNHPVLIDADQVVIRYLRFRMGDEQMAENDALGGRHHRQIIIDHCSMSWSTDECVSFYSNRDFTLQWCMISESLRNSVHGKGAHGYGGIWGGTRASFHHNLLAHHDSRNPRLGETAGDAEALTDLVDLRNNVIYNWGGNSTYGAEAMNVNIINCYYKPGPASTNRGRILSIDKYQVDAASAIYERWGKFYVAGNYVEGQPNSTADNWQYGVANQFPSKYGAISQAALDAMRMNEPHPVDDNVTTHTAQEAYEQVLNKAGASLVRDNTDKRIIANVRNGDYSYPGSNGSRNGIIDSQADVGGWDVYNTAAAPTDTDADGLPDAWEDLRGLDKRDASDGAKYTLSRDYTNLEMYINELVEE